MYRYGENKGISTLLVEISVVRDKIIEFSFKIINNRFRRIIFDKTIMRLCQEVIKPSYKYKMG